VNPEDQYIPCRSSDSYTEEEWTAIDTHNLRVAKAEDRKAIDSERQRLEKQVVEAAKVRVVIGRQWKKVSDAMLDKVKAATTEGDLVRASKMLTDFCDTGSDEFRKANANEDAAVDALEAFEKEIVGAEAR